MSEYPDKSWFLWQIWIGRCLHRIAMFNYSRLKKFLNFIVNTRLIKFRFPDKSDKLIRTNTNWFGYRWTCSDGNKLLSHINASSWICKYSCKDHCKASNYHSRPLLFLSSYRKLSIRHWPSCLDISVCRVSYVKIFLDNEWIKLENIILY